MRVAVAGDAGGGLRFGVPELLFRLAPDTLRGWDVDRDAQRFLWSWSTRPWRCDPTR